MMKFVRWLLLLGLVLALIAGLVVLSGVIPVTASSGHFPITAWGLELAMERSVSTNSLSIESPPLDDNALIVQGAAHFEVGCAWCHGYPKTEPGRIVTQMTPHPSNLDEELEKWSAAQLFYIVRHGVKFTGMPAWPAQNRDDEVWSVVAFLLRYRDLDIAQYQELAGIAETRLAKERIKQGAQIPDVVIEKCVSCHGIDGQGRNAFPSLAGQKREYLSETLSSYRSGQRPSGMMGPLAARLSDHQIEQIAQYFSRLERRKQAIELSEAETRVAMDIVQNGDVKRRAGACMSCHPMDEQTDGEVGAELYPRLLGQRADYLTGQLHLFRANQRGGGSRHHIMQNMVEELSDNQLRVLARFYSAK